MRQSKMDYKKKIMIIWASLLSGLLIFPIYITAIHPAIHNGIDLGLASGTRYMGPLG